MLFLNDIKKEMNHLTYSDEQLNKLSAQWSYAAKEEVKAIQVEDDILNDVVCEASELGALRLFGLYSGINCSIENLKNGRFNFVKHGTFYDKNRYNGKPASTVDELMENAKKRPSKADIFSSEQKRKLG